METEHPQVDSGLEPLMSAIELGDYLGVPVKTIYEWRARGYGPRAIRVGRHLKYAVSDVREWVADLRERALDQGAGGR